MYPSACMNACPGLPEVPFDFLSVGHITQFIPLCDTMEVWEGRCLAVMCQEGRRAECTINQGYGADEGELPGSLEWGRGGGGGVMRPLSTGCVCPCSLVVTSHRLCRVVPDNNPVSFICFWLISVVMCTWVMKRLIKSALCSVKYANMASRVRQRSCLRREGVHEHTFTSLYLLVNWRGHWHSV